MTAPARSGLQVARVRAAIQEGQKPAYYWCPGLPRFDVVQVSRPRVILASAV